jgi:uncharacterized protein YciI
MKENKMFIVSLTYICDLQEVDKYLSAHQLYLDSQYAAGRILASGRKEPRDGGIILADNVTREDLDNILTQDPFYQHGVARYDVTEFIPRKTSASLTCLLN